MCNYYQHSIILTVVLLFTTYVYGYSSTDSATNEKRPIMEYHSPMQKGPHAFIKTREQTLFPSFMKNVNDLTYRIPIKSNSIKPPYPLVIIEPGFFALATSLDNLQDYYASHGFLVAGVNNTSHFNLITTSLEPYRKALLETIQFLLESNADQKSPLYCLIDTNAIGLSGHSMGGGGTLLVCDSANALVSRYIKAAIAMNPFGKVSGKGITIPVLLFASNNDSVPNPFMPGVSSSPANVFFSFNSIPETTPRLFANFDKMNHNGVCDHAVFLPTSGNANTFMPLMVAWFKIHLLKDLRYTDWVIKTGNGFDSLKSRFISKGSIPAYILNQ